MSGQPVAQQEARHYLRALAGQIFSATTAVAGVAPGTSPLVVFSMTWVEVAAA